MHPYPHIYHAATRGGPDGIVTVTSAGLPDLPSAPPPEFDGPGGVWSPESMLCAALADCFVLTFRAIARASKFEWIDVDCSVEGTLERSGGVTRFTRYVTRAALRVPHGTDLAKARQLLEKSEHGCLVSNSVNGARELQTEVIEA
jgi:peroxiredoxin-like protein